MVLEALQAGIVLIAHPAVWDAGPALPFAYVEAIVVRAEPAGNVGWVHQVEIVLFVALSVAVGFCVAHLAVSRTGDAPPQISEEPFINSAQAADKEVRVLQVKAGPFVADRASDTAAACQAIRNAVRAVVVQQIVSEVAGGAHCF